MIHDTEHNRFARASNTHVAHILETVVYRLSFWDRFFDGCAWNLWHVAGLQLWWDRWCYPRLVGQTSGSKNHVSWKWELLHLERVPMMYFYSWIECLHLFGRRLASKGVPKILQWPTSTRIQHFLWKIWRFPFSCTTTSSFRGWRFRWIYCNGIWRSKRLKCAGWCSASGALQDVDLRWNHQKEMDTNGPRWMLPKHHFLADSEPCLGFYWPKYLWTCLKWNDPCFWDRFRARPRLSQAPTNNLRLIE